MDENGQFLHSKWCAEKHIIVFKITESVTDNRKAGILNIFFADLYTNV